jgi:hypothetical protein
MTIAFLNSLVPPSDAPKLPPVKQLDYEDLWTNMQMEFTAIRNVIREHLEPKIDIPKPEDPQSPLAFITDKSAWVPKNFKGEILYQKWVPYRDVLANFLVWSNRQDTAYPPTEFFTQISKFLSVFIDAQGSLSLRPGPALLKHWGLLK